MKHPKIALTLLSCIFVGILSLRVTLTTTQAQVEPQSNLGVWSTEPSLVETTIGPGAAAFENHLYAVGGFAQNLDTGFKVQIATINPDGSLQPWQISSSLLHQRHSQNTVAVSVNGYLYALGGGTPYIEYAQIQSDGSLGNWQLAVNNPGPGTLSATVRDNTIYIQNELGFYRTQVQSDGSLASLETLPSLNTPRYFSSMVNDGHYIYAIGGWMANTSTPLNSIERIEIHSDNTLGSWVTLPNTLQVPTAELSSVVSGGYIYVIGQKINTSNYLMSVEAAAIHADGSLGNFSYMTQSITPRLRFGAVAHNGWVYILGGQGSYTPTSNHTVERVAAGGTISLTPSGPAFINTPISFTSDIVDPQVQGVTSANIDWGDAQTSSGSVSNISNGSRITSSHIYASPGLYTIKLVVTDTNSHTYVSVYQWALIADPNGNTATGHGAIVGTAEGDYKLAVGGEVIGAQQPFNFYAKYFKGLPDGSFKFTQNTTTKYKFEATSFDWVVVTDSSFGFSGTGTFNDIGNYGFLVLGIEGKAAGTNVDKIRIRIWNKDNVNEPVIENQVEQPGMFGETPIKGGVSVH